MGWFPCNMGGGEPEIANILKGISNPTSSIGENGQLYLKTVKGEKVSFNGFEQLKETSMNISVAKDEVAFDYISGGNIGAQVYKQFDLTNVDAIKITVQTSQPSYDNYSTPRFSPILLIENTINPANAYPVNTSIVSANGETYRVTTQGDTVTFEADVSELTGNYWVVLSSVGDTSVWSDLFFLSNSMNNVVCDSFAKVDGQWQGLVGTDVDDIDYVNNPPKTISHLKWQITKTRSVPAGGCIQIAEFRLYQNAEKYVWNSNVSISSDMTGVSGETIDKLIDDNINTKFNTTDWGSVQTNECNIVINLGETITLTNTSSYCFVTANDEATRDPVSWKLYGSADGTNWDLLDERTDADISTDRGRQTVNYPCNIVPTTPLLAEIQSYLEQVQSANPVPITVNFEHSEVNFAFVACEIADNVNSSGVITFKDSSSIRYNNLMGTGFVPVPANKELTGYFPYSDGGAYFEQLGAVGLNKMPTDFRVISENFSTSSKTITLDKTFDHVILFFAGDSESSGITATLNNDSLQIIENPIMYSRYTYHYAGEIDNSSSTFAFVFSSSITDGQIVLFAYDE